MILSGYVNTSSVPHYDCGDAELAHFSFLTDTNLFFFFLLAVNFFGDSCLTFQPWQVNMLC